MEIKDKGKAKCFKRDSVKMMRDRLQTQKHALKLKLKKKRKERPMSSIQLGK